MTLTGLVLVAGCGGTRWSARAGAAGAAVVPHTDPTIPLTEWVDASSAVGVGVAVDLKHPAAWTATSSILQTAPLSVYIDPAADSGGFRRTITVVVQPIPAGVTAADYLRANLAQLASSGATVEKQAPALLGDTAGRQVTWRLTKNGVSVQFLSVWFLRATQVFLVTYAADTANFAGPLADVQRVIATMTFPPSS